MWGQAGYDLFEHEEERIIPTRVGTSIKAMQCRRFCQDHPHACGDKCQCPHCRAPSLGSSPRVWGQVCQKNAISGGERIIPTRVGTSVNVLCVFCVNSDHPHACGDKTNYAALAAGALGSSPRVWGQVYFSLEQLPIERIIPTRVGTSTLT